MNIENENTLICIVNECINLEEVFTKIRFFAMKNQNSRKSLIEIIDKICQSEQVLESKKDFLYEYIDALEGNINVSCFEKLYKDPSDINEFVDFVKCKGYEKMDYYIENWREIK